MLSYDDGVDRINYGLVSNAVGDNVNRFGLNYDRALSNGWDLTGTFEFSVAPKASNQVNQLDKSDSSWRLDQNSLRKIDLKLAHDRIGTFFVGHGDMSGREAAPDYSGTTVIASSNPGEFAGGSFWRHNPSGVLRQDRRVRQSFENYDSGRRLRVRYDTPTWKGLRFSTSVGREVLTSGDDSTYFDALLNYEKKWRAFDVALQMSVKGFGHNGYAGGLGFAAIHKGTGLNIAVSTNHTNEEFHYGYGKVGWKWQFLNIGPTAISYDHYNSGNIPVMDAESISEGISIVQTIERANAEVYLSFRNYQGYNNANIASEEFLTSVATMFGVNWTF